MSKRPGAKKKARTFARIGVTKKAKKKKKPPKSMSQEQQ